MAETVLALNAGSSTLKFTLFRFTAGREEELLSGSVESSQLDAARVLDQLGERIAARGLPQPVAVAHRLVHGGARFVAPVLVDSGVLAELDDLVSLAPLHLPPALRLLRAALERFSNAAHVACFDTAFHHSLPGVSRRLPLPADLHERGVRRYGFHGLSYEYVVAALGAPPPARLIVAHLGGGASLAAIRDGRSMDTSMGLTPTGGIPMGTRSGDLDPGVLLYLQREQGYSLEKLEHLVNHEAGLLGLSGSSDMAELAARAGAGDDSALGAIASFSYAIKKQIGGYFAALGGLDCLVFTGGIGQNVPRVRELACAGLAELGIELDAARNAQNAPLISRSGSRCQVRVMATNEALVLARSAHALLWNVSCSSRDEDT